MREFLSEENIDLHREYLRNMKLKYSILTDSIPSLRDAGFKHIGRMKMTDRDRRDALGLFSEIRMHDVFFSSFSSTRFLPSALAARCFGSEASLLNEIYRQALLLPYGFASVYVVGGRPCVRGSISSEELLSYGDPVLAIDVSEHAYFMDYRFDKDRYLVCALPYLDMTKI